VIDQYCVGCHNQKLQTAGLALDSVDPREASAHADVWEKVVRKLRMGQMPPAGLPRPDQATYDALSAWLETEIDRGAMARPNPGRTAAFHRLNRAEYQNAIRDLLGIELDVASLLPIDPATAGLDNMANMLSISPALMARYTSAARKISRLAVGLAPPAPVAETYSVSSKLNQDAHLGEDFTLGSRGGLAFRHYFPIDGEYEVKVTLKREGYLEYPKEPSLLDLRLDGARVQRFTVDGDDKTKPVPLSYDARTVPGDRLWEASYGYSTRLESPSNADNLTVRVPVKAGPHQVSAAFVEKLAEPDGVLQAGRVAFAGGDELKRSVNDNDIVSLLTRPEVTSVAITGPYNDTRPEDAATRQKILVCQPTGRTNEAACAKTIVTRLARLAYRRPVTDSEVQSLVDFYKAGRREGSFDDGIQLALERLLVAPSFLFRIEHDPATARPNTPYQISDLELASRLAFFLWSSIPDQALLDVAAKGALSAPGVLEREARRLLADPRSTALVDNFFTQWLDLRTLRTLAPDIVQFPDFDENLRTALQREIELFLRSQLTENRSVTELLTANYTFVDERLARHYRIPNVYGSAFRRITLADDARIGLLGKGGILAVTSYANRTSPVLRGKWVIANLLGTPPPPPPPNVPSLKENAATDQPASVRERLEQHRKNPVCANCHAQFDPLGLALENFDATGAWRTKDAGVPIDASATMPGTGVFQGPVGLRQFLLSHREQVVSAVTEKLLAYALGRRTEYYDRPVIRVIVREAKANDYRWSSILVGIVNSGPFRMRMPASGDSKPATTTVASLKARRH
jgi:hypothetical protein